MRLDYELVPDHPDWQVCASALVTHIDWKFGTAWFPGWSGPCGRGSEATQGWLVGWGWSRSMPACVAGWLVAPWRRLMMSPPPSLELRVLFMHISSTKISSTKDDLTPFPFVPRPCASISLVGALLTGIPSTILGSLPCCCGKCLETKKVLAYIGLVLGIISMFVPLIVSMIAVNFVCMCARARMCFGGGAIVCVAPSSFGCV